MIKKTVSIITVIVLAVIITGCTNDEQTRSSPDKICLQEGKNQLILDAIKKKYPQSELLKVYDNFSMSMGPHWELKIKTQSDETVTEYIKCWRHYSINECNDTDQCYSHVAWFYNDINICKKIINSQKKNNCFALIAGLSSPDNWNPSICDKLSDQEGKIGCIKFFEEDKNN